MNFRKLLLVFPVCLAAANGAECVLPTGSVVQIAVDPHGPKLKKAGESVEGTVARRVYNVNCLVIPAGSRVRATREDAGLRLELAQANGPAVAVKAAMLRMGTEREIEAGKKAGARVRMLVARLNENAGPFAAEELPVAPLGQKAAVPAGTEVRVALEGEAGSRRSRDGEAVRARVLEPVMSGGNVVVPEGALIEGAIANARRARRPYRAGGLRLNFHSIQFPGGRAVIVPMNITGARLSGGARVDAEGAITGSALTRKRALINLAIAYATGKILDDVIEEGAKAALGAAVAGSAETVARYVGLAAGTAVFLMHRGREVTLQPHTELVLTFSRDVEIAR